MFITVHCIVLFSDLGMSYFEGRDVLIGLSEFCLYSYNLSNQKFLDATCLEALNLLQHINYWLEFCWLRQFCLIFVMVVCSWNNIVIQSIARQRMTTLSYWFTTMAIVKQVLAKPTFPILLINNIVTLLLASEAFRESAIFSSSMHQRNNRTLAVVHQ